MEEVLLRWGPLLVSCASLIFAIGAARNKAASDRIKAVEDKSSDVEARVSKIEGEFAHLPDRNVTHRLEMTITELNGRMAVMDERLKPVAEMARRVHDRLFEEVRT